MKPIKGLNLDFMDARSRTVECSCTGLQTPRVISLGRDLSRHFLVMRCFLKLCKIRSLASTLLNDHNITVLD